MDHAELAQEVWVEAPSDLKRRLAAIAFADVAGYSRLMDANEAETIRRWKALQAEIVEPLMARHGGHLVDRAGDLLMVEFASVVNAVRWAIEVQRSHWSGGNYWDPFALRLRVGVNVEDVIDDRGILRGHGVNVAARIHQVAEPGQIVVTAAVRDCIINRLPVAFRDLGTPALKNITRPVRVFAVEWDAHVKSRLSSQPYLQWSARPTFAVLPFRTIGGAKDDGYFGEGITEDIITGLSSSRSLYVVARNSTLRYRDREKDLRQTALELDVRYVLDGERPAARNPSAD